MDRMGKGPEDPRYRCHDRPSWTDMVKDDQDEERLKEREMKLRCSRKDLIDAVFKVGQLIPKRPSVHVLKNVMLTNDKPGMLTVLSSDLSSGAMIHIDSQIESGDSCGMLIDVLLLKHCLKSMTGNEIEIDVHDETTVSLKSGTSTFKMHCLPTDDFPNVQSMIGLCDRFDVPVDVLRTLFSRVKSGAASKSDVRPVFLGVLIRADVDGSLAMITTDGRRMSCASLPDIVTGRTSSRRMEFVINVKSFDKLLKMLAPNEPVTVSVTEFYAHFEQKHARVFSRLLEGVYPSREQLLPRSFRATINVGRVKLEEILKMALVTAVNHDVPGKVILDFDVDRLRIMSGTPEIGEFSNDMPIELSGAPTRLALNGAVLLEFLRQCSSYEVQFKLQDPLSPLIVKDLGPVDYDLLTMPINVDA